MIIRIDRGESLSALDQLLYSGKYLVKRFHYLTLRNRQQE
jgi:hypothetical protein